MNLRKTLASCSLGFLAKMSLSRTYQQPSGRIKNQRQRRFSFLFMIMAVSSILTFLLLNSFNFEWGSELVIRNGASRMRNRLNEPPDFDYFPDNKRSRKGGKKNILDALDGSKGEQNHLSKGLFLSKLRQQQAKLIQMNYHAIMYPMKKQKFPFEEAQTLQRNVVANVCSSLEENAFHPVYSVKPPIPGHLLVDDNHRLIFCQVRKVASITWRQILDEGANKKGSHQIRRLSTYTAAEREDRLKRYTKIMFVREPILRVVSGWYDKFIMANDRDQLEYVVRYGCDIARRARRNISNIKLCRQGKSGDDDDLTGVGLLSRMKEARALRVSFQEFAQYLINGPVAIKNDMHWETYHTRCQPCQVTYDYIGHYETMNSDANVIMHRVGLSNDVFPFPVSRSKSEDIAREVLSDLDPLLLMRLSELYHLDYQLFGYNLRKLQEWIDEDLDVTMFNKNY